MKEVIVFAPHPDDETFGCGGTIAKKLSEGYEVSIVFMTDGRNAYLEMFGLTSEPTPYELKEIRKEEAKRVANILGVPKENLFFLDIEDGMLGKNKRKAQEKVIEILLSKRPAMEVYFTYEKDFHTDHRATNDIVKNSIEKLHFNPTEYQYTIARTCERIHSLEDALFNLLRHNIIHVDISKFLPLKRRAMKEYRSQISILSNRQKRPCIESSFLERFLKNEETFFIDRRHYRVRRR